MVKRSQSLVKALVALGVRANRDGKGRFRAMRGAATILKR